MKLFSCLIFCFYSFLSFSQKSIKQEQFNYNPEYFLHLGVTAHEAGKLDSALIYFDRVLPNDPLFLNAAYEKSITLQAQEKNAEAVKMLSEIYKTGTFKDFPLLYINYGNSLDENKELDKADSIFSEGQKYLPNNSNIYFNQAIVKIKKLKNQEGVDLLKKCIDLDPSHSSALYFLGFLALQDGRLSEGCLTLMASLTIKPSGRYSDDIIKKLNVKMAQNFLPKNELKFSSTGDDFTELEEILRNQLPLNKKYKLKCDIDEPFSRHVQAICEYAKSHIVKNGYFEQKFIPYLAEIDKNQLTENFIYYLLAGLEGDIAKTIKKHTSDVEKLFNNYIKTTFWEAFAKRNNVYGLNGNVVVYYEDGHPSLVSNVKDGLKQGSAVELNKEGNIIVTSTYKDDELDGLIKQFNHKGNLEEETTYSIGKKNGANIGYYPNGCIAYKQNFINNELSGPYISYFPTGSKKAEAQFEKDKLTKEVKYYFQNGNLESISHYLNGEKNGKEIKYNEVGDIIFTANYVNNLFDGEVVEYFDGKKIKSKGSYAKGELVSNELKYHENGKVAEEIVLNKNQSKVRTYYDVFDVKESEEYFDKNFNLQKYITYNVEGKLNVEQEFNDDGNLKEIKQYNNKTDKPTVIKINKGKYTLKNRNGVRYAEGAFIKSNKDKEWTFYYLNGRPYYTMFYENGIANGMYNSFDVFGNKESEYTYIDDNIGGLSNYYVLGKLESKYYYNEGKANGPFERYNKDGKIITSGIYEDDDLKKVEHRNDNGKLTSVSENIDNISINKTYYDYNGKFIKDVNFLNLNGEQIVNINDTRLMESYKNGINEGPFLYMDSNQDTITNGNCINNKFHGLYKYFNPSGTLGAIAYYYCGKINGEHKFFDLNGSLRGQSYYHFGNDSGKALRYYKNGKIAAEYSQINDLFHGENKYYNQDGDHVVSIFFNRNYVIGYSKLDKGVMSSMIPIDTNEIDVKSIFSNGKTACQFRVDQMLLNGKFIIYDKEGNADLEFTEYMGELNGKRIEYYENNKIYKSESFAYGKNSGLSEYFEKDGSFMYTAEYDLGDLHGDFTIYKNGKKALVKKFERGDLIDIIKI